jgi:K+-sensing histidine kinase KdpD
MRPRLNVRALPPGAAWNESRMKVLSTLQRYGLAIISCGVALAVAWPINAPSSCFFLAVTVSSLFGDLGPGLLAVAPSALALNHFFLWRTFTADESAAFLRFAVFLKATLLVTALMEIKRRAEESRARAQERLQRSQSYISEGQRVAHMG